MIQINRNLYPRDGYFFKESDGTRIGGDTWAGVIKRVQNYRKRNHMPPGNPDQEVITQACQRNPGLCVQENSAYTAEVSRASLKNRVLMWLSAMQKKAPTEPHTFVSAEEFASRAAICAGCPLNTALPEGCSSCKAAVTESRKNIVGGRHTDGRLNSCSGTGEELNTSAWIEQVRVEDGALPGNCWRKRTM